MCRGLYTEILCMLRLCAHEPQISLLGENSWYAPTVITHTLMHTHIHTNLPTRDKSAQSMTPTSTVIHQSRSQCSLCVRMCVCPDTK